MVGNLCFRLKGPKDKQITAVKELRKRSGFVPFICNKKTVHFQQ